jgi:hypothetical protein
MDRESSYSESVAEGYGKRGLRSQVPNRPETSVVVIRVPNRIFENRKAGARSRKRVRPFAFKRSGRELQLNLPGRQNQLAGEKFAMSASHEKWIDRWWPLFLILFGVLFVTVLVSFSPTI